MTLQPNQDPSSVYYIHPSDASTTQLVSVKFSGTGFHNWKRSMMLTLSAKNKLGFVNGTISAPDAASNEYKHWERCNDLVISWLIFNLDETIAKSVLFMKTASEIWNELEERYGYASAAQTYVLEQQLSEITQGSDTVSAFFTKIKTLWDGLADVSPLPVCTCQKCTCNITQRLFQKQQEQKVLQFMMKLSDSFATVRGNVFMMQPLPNIAQTYRLFAQEERHKEISNVTNQTEAMAFYADKRKFNNQGRFNGAPTGNRGNWPNNNNPNAKKPNKPSYYCTHCKIPSHSVERCFKIHGFPPGFQAKQQEKKVAALAQQTDADNVQTGNDTGTNMSPEQYN
nr:PREDICTED: uncharacterized protein LOC108221639 [Daucus carota subsp. sativus]